MQGCYSGVSLALHAAAVNGAILVKLGGTVRYTVKLTNGAETIPTTSSLSVTVNGATPVTAPVCKLNGGTVGSPLSVPLGDGAVVFCTFDVLVNDAHEASGEIPALTVQAAYAPTDNTLYIPPVTVPRWPVYTNATMLSITYAVGTTDGTYLTSKHMASLRMQCF